MIENRNMAGRGKVLLFHFEDKAQLQAVQMALFLAQVQCRIVSRQEYGLPLKMLAGDQTPSHSAGRLIDEKLPAAASAYRGQELPGQMMVFAGLREEQLSGLLSLLRSNPACGKIPYKAVLTPSNQEWSGFTLFAELEKEHAAMTLAAGKKG